MEYQIILATVIALCAVLSVLSFIFNWLLTPLKENQVHLDQRLDKIEVKLDTIKKTIEKTIEAKLDIILSHNEEKAKKSS